MTDRGFIDSQAIIAECRFCSSKGQIQGETFVTPCGCIGSQHYAHRDCLSKWITRKYEEASQRDPFEVYCERCSARILFNYTIIHNWADMEDFKGKINDSKIVFILHVIGILVSLSLSVFMLTKAIILYDEKANITLQHTTIAFFTGFLLFLPILFLCCILFIRHYLLNQSIRVNAIANFAVAKTQPVICSAKSVAKKAVCTTYDLNRAKRGKENKPVRKQPSLIIKSTVQMKDLTQKQQPGLDASKQPPLQLELNSNFSRKHVDSLKIINKGKKGTENEYRENEEKQCRDKVNENYDPFSERRNQEEKEATEILEECK